MLRNFKGKLLDFQEVRGQVLCHEWMLSRKTERLPVGCEFLFRDDDDGTYYTIRSDEMVEGGIFQVMRSAMRGQERYVSL